VKRALDGWTLARISVALGSFVPFAFGLAEGGCFYFRDLSSQFFPLRRFVVEGLRQGQLRQWNPYISEGMPVLLPPLGYPLDALQALVPNEWGFSLLLALHVPLAALAFLGLGRRLGAGPAAAALGALVYALGGFTLSSLNLYIHLQALAWAPLVVSLLLRAAAGGGREIALAALACGLCFSTTGVEIAAQAVACAFLLSASRRLDGLFRLAASVLLGFGIAASPLTGIVTQVSGSQRAAGFKAAESLAHSVHPLSLLQVLFAGIYGNPVAAGSDYWGGRFWSGQFPYFLSLYLGGASLSLALIGACSRDRYRARLLILLAAGLALGLGRFARLDLILELVPILSSFRYPVKAFFSVMLAVSLLASAGAERVLASRRGWSLLLWVSSVVGLVILGLAGLAASAMPWLHAFFFPSAFPEALRFAALRSIAGDAAAGAAACLALAGLAWLALRERLTPRVALAAAAAVIAADLVRAGAGLNPVAPRSLYTLSPEMTVVAERLRQSGGRVFTCAVQAMPTFREAASHMSRAGLWSTAVRRESLTPWANMDAGIETTGADATALVASRFSMTVDDALCRDPGTLDRLRAAGVRFVLSVQPFTNEALGLVDVASPARIAPLSVYVYQLTASLPDPGVSESPDDLDAAGRARALEGATARYLDAKPGLVRVGVQTARAGWLILRRASAAGWTATVNGEPRELVLANGRHIAVAVPEGASDVTLRYRAPHAALGLAISLASLAGALGLVGLGRKTDTARAFHASVSP
jgi:hypothetical protein